MTLIHGETGTQSLIGYVLDVGDQAGAVCWLDLDDRHLNRQGILHGGLAATLLDSAMGATGSLTVVVPRHEQSWKAKAMTRFGDLKAEPLTLSGVEAMTLTGTPADCVNFGLYNLYDTLPDLVVAARARGLLDADDERFLASLGGKSTL